MSESEPMDRGAIRLWLPATSANLGPGFDTAAVALGFGLEIEATAGDQFSVEATGRDRERCGSVTDNLVLDLYQQILREQGKPVTPLAVRMHNDIPLGMGCGSSAAGRLAALSLAVHFGSLEWDSERILAEASALEGHPDNVAACLLGGFVAAADFNGKVKVVRVTPPAEWRAIVVLPHEPLATSKARAVLPDSYSRGDVVANLQSIALLGMAWAQGRGDLLQAAMRDRVHQPYREGICPQLPRLLPLAGENGVLGVALSGAGPAVLVIVENEAGVAGALHSIRKALADMAEPELLVGSFSDTGARALPAVITVLS